MEPFDFLYPQASAGLPDAAQAEFTTVEMQPGTVFYIPRGTWHATEAGGDSLSVSTGIYLPSAADCVLEQLQLLLVQDGDWRQPVYGACGDDVAREQAAARLARLIERLPRDCTSLSVDSVLAALGSNDARLAAIAPTSRFQKTPPSRLAIEPGAGAQGRPGEVVLISLTDANYGERPSMRLEVTPDAAAVFRWIGETRAAFTAAEVAAEFPAFGFDQDRQLLEAATRAGLVRLFWFPALAE